MMALLMKSFLLVLISLTIFLPQPIEALNKQGAAEISFAEGMLAYQAGNYSKAEQAFARALQHQPTHPAAAYFLGMSYFHQEKYAEAVEALETAIRLRPKEAEPYLYRGIAQFRLEQKTAAIDDFKKAAQLSRGGPVGDVASSYLRRIEQGEEPLPVTAAARSWFVGGHLQALYDTNVSLNPESVALATLPTDQGDIQTALGLEGGYHLINRPSYRLTTEGSYRQTLYIDLNSFNYGLAHLGVENRLRRGELELLLPVAAEYSILDRSRYLMSGLLEPAVGYRLAERWLTRLTTRGRLDQFNQTLTNQSQDRDARNLQVEVEEFLLGDGQGEFLKASYLLEQNWADGNDWDYRAHTIGLALLNRLPWELSFYLHADYTIDKKFAHVDSVLGSQRDDTLQVYGLNLTCPLWRHWSISGMYDFYRNRSNLAFFSYNRHLAGVMLAFSY